MNSVTKTGELQQETENLPILTDAEQSQLVDALASMVLKNRDLKSICHEFGLTSDSATVRLKQFLPQIRKQIVKLKLDGSYTKSKAANLLDSSLERIEDILEDSDASHATIIKATDTLSKISGATVRADVIERSKAGHAGQPNFSITINLGEKEPVVLTGTPTNPDIITEYSEVPDE